MYASLGAMHFDDVELASRRLAVAGCNRRVALLSLRFAVHRSQSTAHLATAHEFSLSLSLSLFFSLSLSLSLSFSLSLSLSLFLFLSLFLSLSLSLSLFFILFLIFSLSSFFFPSIFFVQPILLYIPHHQI